MNRALHLIPEVLATHPPLMRRSAPVRKPKYRKRIRLASVLNLDCLGEFFMGANTNVGDG